MKTLIGYKALTTMHRNGGLVYSLNWQCIGKASARLDGSLSFPHPNLKLRVTVDDTCIAIERSPGHKILIQDHGRKIYETVEVAVKYYDNSHLCHECNGWGCKDCGGTGVTRWPLSVMISGCVPPAIAHPYARKFAWATFPPRNFKSTSHKLRHNG